MATTESAAPEGLEGAGPQRRWPIFCTVSLAVMLGGIDQTIVATALRTIDRSLHASVAWGAWTITGYQLGTVMAMPVMGRISDQFGRKRVFIACVCCFTLASLGCCLATNIFMLVPFRLVQALGGGGFMPSASGIVSDIFGRDRDRAIGMFTSIFPLGSMTGPIFGGLIINYWSWREIFLVNIPIGVVLVVLALRLIPHSPPKNAARPDFTGIGLLAAFIASLMTAISVLGSGTEAIGAELVEPVFLAPALAFVLLLVLFTRHIRSADAPIIPPKLLSQRAFKTMNLLNIVYGGCVVGFAALVPLYAQDRYHIGSLQAGTLLTARSIGAVLVAGTTSFLLRRLGYRLPMMIGFGGGVAGLLLLATTSPRSSVYASLAFGAAVMGMGNGMAGPATNNAAIALAPNDVAAMSGMRGSFRQFGGILAISVTTALVNRSDHPGVVFSHCLFTIAMLIVLVSPLILTVPNERADW